MPAHPLNIIEKHDHELFQAVDSNRKLALSEGVLPEKYKLLIAMALDAAHGAVEGVRSLAGQAMAAGATGEEIMETLRIVNYVSGAGGIYTAAAGLREML